MKYKKLEDYIVKCIESGVYKVGDAIESEEEICKKFNIQNNNKCIEFHTIY